MRELEGKFFNIAASYDKRKEKTVIDLDALQLIIDFCDSKTNDNDRVRQTPITTPNDDAKAKRDEEFLIELNKDIGTSTNLDLIRKAQEERRNFRKTVWFLMHDCLVRGKQPWKNPNCVIGEAPGFDICYDKDKIMEHQSDILTLLEQIGDVTRFEDLKYLKSGEEWTILRQQIGILMTLANAAGLMDFKNPDLERYQNYNPNPEISLKRRK